MVRSCFHYLVHLLKMGVPYWFRPPEWTPEGDKIIPDVHPDTYEKWTTSVSHWTTGWVSVQFVPVVFALVGILWFAKTLDWPTLTIAGGLVLWATWSFGALLEGRSWAWTNEALRLVVTAVALVGFMGLGTRL